MQWGAVERSPETYDWEGYRQVFDLAKSLNLKIQVVLSFHACGGNVGDSAQIPLPKWVLEVCLDPSHPWSRIRRVSTTGSRSTPPRPAPATDLCHCQPAKPLLGGRTRCALTGVSVRIDNGGGFFIIGVCPFRFPSASDGTQKRLPFAHQRWHKFFVLICGSHRGSV